MRRFWKQGVAVLTLATAVGLWCLPASQARPPSGGNPPVALPNPAIAFVTTQTDTRRTSSLPPPIW